VAIDNSGFTWVSTRNGLQRFNGFSLDNIDPVIGKDTIFIHSPVYLFGLRNGSLWISYNEGVLDYDPHSGSFRKIISLSRMANVFFQVVPLLETPEGIWCMQQNKGIVIYRIPGNKCIAANSLNLNDVINSEEITDRSIISSNGKYIFIRTANNLLLQINTDNHETKRLDNYQNIMAIGSSHDRLFVLTDHYLAAVNITNGQIERKTLVSGLLTYPIMYGCVQPENNDKLIVSLNGFLYEYDSTLSSPHELTTLNEDPIVPSGLVHQIFTDRFDRIWVLTNNDIRIVQNFDIPFEYYAYRNTINNIVRTIYFDDQAKEILAGCIDIERGKNGGIRLFDTSGNQLWSQPVMANNVYDINDIEKLSTGHYLVVTFDHQGWYMLDLKRKHLSKIALPVNAQVQAQLLKTVWPNNEERIDDSTLLFASAINVYQVIFRNNILRSIKPLLPLNGNSYHTIDCFIYTTNKDIWAGTDFGTVYRYTPNGALQTFQIPGDYYIRSMGEDRSHHIWIGTDKGIYIFSNTGQQIKTIDVQSGLLNDYIYAMLPLNNDNAMFCSTKMGLSYVPLHGRIKNYTKELGLQESEFNTQSAVKTPNGKFYFGGVNGITAFYPAAISESIDKPILNITRLTINDAPYIFSSRFWRNDSVLLKYDQNYLQFDFAALGTLNTDQYEYRYRLKGLEEKWHVTHVPTGIKYVLQPGAYYFEISRTPLFSTGSFIKKTITIIITPPWWQTLWFRILGVSFLVIVIVLSVQQYLRRKYLKTLRALELHNEIQNERNRISRELHDNIGSQLSFISSNIDWVIDKKGKLGTEEELEQIKAINDTAKNVMINLRETIWALNKDEITIQEFFDKLKSYAQTILQLQPGLELRSKEQIIDNIVLGPTEMLNIFRICQECLNNVIKHARASQLTLTISAQEKSIAIRIEDNGIGFLASESPEGHYGLANMKHRAEELGAKLTIRSAPGIGTAVDIQK